VLGTWHSRFEVVANRLLTSSPGVSTATTMDNLAAAGLARASTERRAQPVPSCAV